MTKITHRVNSANPPQSILVLGAYGLIGYGITKRLLADGHTVTGMGRNPASAQRVLPEIPWIIEDISHLRSADDWRSLLTGFSVVVNCSGALQDSAKDDLEALHHHVVAALASACAQTNTRLIQISATGAHPDAPTRFLASKARGDAAIRASKAAYQIFRPGLVIAPHAYGGSAMLRLLAAVPWVQPIAMAEAQIQTVSLAEVAAIVSAAVSGDIANAYEADLVEAHPRSLLTIVTDMRQWLGFEPAKFTIPLPRIILRMVSALADGLGWLGWQSPLRSTAVAVLADGVRGTPAELGAFGLSPVRPWPHTLAQMHARAEDQLFARMLLLTPIILICLSLFWLVSGIIGLIEISQAASLLQEVGWPEGLAKFSVAVWSLIDIAIAVGFACRKSAPAACWAAIGVSLFYLVAATLWIPALWLDPLGPLVKILPGIPLALVARVALETR